jgi:predicted MFS family arabinose efflux permease
MASAAAEQQQLGAGSRRGWTVLAAYGLVCAATQVLWLTFAAITTESAHHYGVSVGAIGWLAEIFPLVYVVLALPAGVLLDRWFRPSLAAGGALVAAGGLVRLGGDSFAWAMAGQALVSIAQPVVVSAVSKLAGEYLPQPQRAAGIALASAGSFVGMVLALILGPVLATHGDVERLLQVQAAIALVPAVLLAFALMAMPPLAVASSHEQVAIEGGAARALWRRREMRVLCGLVAIGFGVFVALATWLQQLLEPIGVSEKQAGGLLVTMVLAGIVGCAVFPPLVDRRGSERGFVLSAVLAAAGGCALLGVLRGLGAEGLTLAAMGVLLLAALPVILTSAERLAGAHAGTAGAIVWMAGNLGGLVVALIVQALVHHPLAAFLTMAGISLAGVPIARLLKPMKAPPIPA